MKFSMMQDIPQSKDFINKFGGYNHTDTVAQNEFYDMKNMSSKNYPTLSPRCKRGKILTDKNIEGFIYAPDAGGYYYISNGKLYSDGSQEGIDFGFTSGEKTLIRMGAYVIVFPDGIYFSVFGPESDAGHINSSAVTTTQTTTFTLCKEDGTDYLASEVTLSDDPPETPSNGDLWIDTLKARKDLANMSQFFAQSNAWIHVPCYLKISISDVDLSEKFKVGDSVYIDGVNTTAEGAFHLKDLLNKKYFEVVAISGTSIVIEGSTGVLSVPQYSGGVELKVEMPEMEYVIESGNRLWGCSKNYSGLNEIYASKLGNFRNWHTFKGISTDSYVASCGAEGEWTGAISYNGYPYFFKEKTMFKVYGNIPSSYQIQTTECDGVALGASKSLAIVNNVLYYKSKNGVCAFNGSLPSIISTKLGETYSGSDSTIESPVFYGATAGTIKDKYYISMKSSVDNKWHLFVYDTLKGLWHREDNLCIRAFYTYKVNYLIDLTMPTLLCAKEYINGVPQNGLTLVGLTDTESKKHATEDDVEWMVETGAITQTYTQSGAGHSPNKKYVSRLNIRLDIELGAKVCLYIQYDSKGEWEHVSTIMGTTLHSCGIGVRPKRCDHFRIRLEGKGEAKILSIAKTLEIGSDR